ncbi:vWA domain-containing protein [Methylophaga sp. OBS1]|jgi:mxaC protein|uniref:vWA domain-containing protein n=1 Tax=Methylophaga sp. OBS1 TaxID=2991933 RepID=UPI002256F403|nr:vWA domain-containing protein [Methylophaga sp. OBS1]MCX4190924.1 VWA domain-containing protein [Methylophaga sp. OBS1]MCX4192130.1 VWA domain-containing protein [Methylophaga sp. OBS1]
MLGWEIPGLLWLLPLALLPWLSHNTDKTVAWQAMLPHDRLSTLLTLLFKLLGSLAIASLLLSLAGPYIPERLVERNRQGAEFVILLDRSRSMDDIFARPPRNTLPRQRFSTRSKRTVSGDYLLEFVKRRPDDRFGYILFSTSATEILPLSYNREAILATIEAGALGKGLSKTDIFQALRQAAEMFEGEAYRGSRNILLISDGGEILDADEKSQVQALLAEMRINLYWIYLRSMRGMTLDEQADDNLLWLDMPERKLHRFFKQLTTPYQAFEAGSLKEFAAAIDEIDRQQYQPLIIEERLPKQSRADVLLYLALLCCGVLAFARLYTRWGVEKAFDKHSD